MTEPRAAFVLGLTSRGFHRIRYWEWGDPANPRVLICVHGLTRNGRDFDALAASLAGRYRVLCPDVAGRGESDWIAAGDYSFPQYCADMTALIARAGAAEVDWVGTSMGGIIGMILAAQARTPIRRLVLNDVGPFVPKAAQDKIAETVGDDPEFASVEAAADYVATVNSGFGRLTPAQWLGLARTAVKRRDDGKYVWKRDPAIGRSFVAQPRNDVVLWPIWDTIKSPVLVLRGVESELLPAAVAEDMTRRGPKARLVSVADAGHAPALLTERELAPIRAFLAET
ncbi:MAG: alpha/beta hydrolase [Alphaproteobacteria bacterium]